VPTAVRDLELDLDAFEGPFDLLLTLLLREELAPGDVDMAAIVVAFVERLAARDELDLEACGEFLVLIAALLELKARSLFPEEAAELAELGPEEAAEELARRLAEYRRMREAARWLADRLGAERERFFRLGPAPLAPRPERRLAGQQPEQLAAALRSLAVPPPAVSLSHMALRFPPVGQFLERFRALLRGR
jgi:segregation and condensation protein A